MSEASVPLSQIPAGERVRIESLQGGPTFLSRMAALGSRPGVCLKVIQNRGAVVVRSHETRVVLGRGEADKIRVSRRGRSKMLPSEADLSVPEPKRYLVALAGQPNVGKSTIFNLLTGLNQHVGNWPGKTMEKEVGHHRFGDEVLLELIDLPGNYSLTANSLEERISRDFIIQEQPDVVVVVADATHLERGLYLLAEVLALPVKVMLAINMMDLAEEEGIHIEPRILQEALGLPVIPMAASLNQGVRELVDAVVEIAKAAGPSIRIGRNCNLVSKRCDKPLKQRSKTMFPDSIHWIGWRSNCWKGTRKSPPRSNHGCRVHVGLNFPSVCIPTRIQSWSWWEAAMTGSPGFCRLQSMKFRVDGSASCCCC